MKNPVTVFSRRSSLPTQGPWRAMAELENEMDRWFRSRVGSFPSLSALPEEFDFSPTADFQETDKEYILKMDIPGIKKSEIKIEVEGNTLTVSGERKEEKEEKSAKRHYTESSYGSFMRSFSLPQPINEKEVKAQYIEGILKVTVPKTDKSNAKTIAIQ
jgi:HSP20 family protein